MGIIRGHRESRGTTAEDLDPLAARAARAAEGKVSAEEAHYTEGGPWPFVCLTCRHMRPDSFCDLVDGPDRGKVDKDDSCSLWKPSPRMVRGKAASRVHISMMEED